MQGQPPWPSLEAILASGGLLSARTESRQRCAGVQARMNFKRQGRAFVLSACTPGPPFSRGPRISSAPHPVRRWGKPIREAPLFAHRFPVPCSAADSLTDRAWCIPDTGAPAAFRQRLVRTRMYDSTNREDLHPLGGGPFLPYSHSPCRCVGSPAW